MFETMRVQGGKALVARAGQRRESWLYKSNKRTQSASAEPQRKQHHLAYEESCTPACFIEVLCCQGTELTAQTSVAYQEAEVDIIK